MTNILRFIAAVYMLTTLGPVYSSDFLETKRDQNGRWIVLKTGEDIANRAFADENINVSLLAYCMERFPEKFEAVKTTRKRRGLHLCVGKVLPEFTVNTLWISGDNHEWEHEWKDDKSLSTVMRNTDTVQIWSDAIDRGMYTINFINETHGRLFTNHTTMHVNADNLNRFIAECGEHIASSHEALVADHEALKSENHSLRTELTIERDEFEKEIERLNAEINRMREENERLQQSLDSSSVSGRCISPEPCEPGNCPGEGAEINRMREENERLQQSLDSSSVSGSCISPEPCESENCPEWEGFDSGK